MFMEFEAQFDWNHFSFFHRTLKMKIFLLLLMTMNLRTTANIYNSNIQDPGINGKYEFEIDQ